MKKSLYVLLPILFFVIWYISIHWEFNQKSYLINFFVVWVGFVCAFIGFYLALTINDKA